MTTQRHDAGAWAAHVAHEQLQDRTGTDELGTHGVLRPTQRVGKARRALTAGVLRNGVSQVVEVFLRNTAGLLHHLRGVAGVVALQDLEHTIRVLQRLVLLHIPGHLRIPSWLRLPRGVVVLTRLRVIAREDALKVFRVLEVLIDDHRGIGKCLDKILKVELIVQHVLNHRAKQHHIRATSDRDVLVGDCGRSREPRVHVNNPRATILGFNHPLEAHRVCFGHIRPLNDNAVRIRHILQRLGRAATAKRGSQTGNRGGVSYTGLIFNLHRARGSPEFLNQVVFLVVHGRTAKTSDAHGAANRVAVLVRVLPAVLAGLHEAIRNHLQRGFTVKRLPLRCLRRTVEHLSQTVGGVD